MISVIFFDKNAIYRVIYTMFFIYFRALESADRKPIIQISKNRHKSMSKTLLQKKLIVQNIIGERSISDISMYFNRKLRVDVETNSLMG